MGVIDRLIHTQQWGILGPRCSYVVPEVKGTFAAGRVTLKTLIYQQP